MAAQYVGCLPRAIQETADHDLGFAEKLRKKEQSVEITYLENIRKAAQDQRHWRAAAWALERIRPERYAQRRPDSITVEQVRNLLTQFTQVITEEVPARYRKNILKRFAAISAGLKGTSKP